MQKIPVAASSVRPSPVMCASGCWPAHLRRGVDVLPAEDAVAQGGGCVVIDELQHFEAGHAGRLQHGPPLGLVEEGWHSDDGVLDGLF